MSKKRDGHNLSVANLRRNETINSSKHSLLKSHRRNQTKDFKLSQDNSVNEGLTLEKVPTENVKY